MAFAMMGSTARHRLGGESRAKTLALVAAKKYHETLEQREVIAAQHKALERAENEMRRLRESTVGYKLRRFFGGLFRRQA